MKSWRQSQGSSRRKIEKSFSSSSSVTIFEDERDENDEEDLNSKNSCRMEGGVAAPPGLSRPAGLPYRLVTLFKNPPAY